MQFLVTMEVALPPDMPADKRETLVKAEATRARELIEAGLLVNIWRVPGRRANVGIWDASDATSLHAALTSLPMWPWLDAQVTALASHPNAPVPR